MTAGEVLFLETRLLIAVSDIISRVCECIVSYGYIPIYPENEQQYGLQGTQTNNEAFVFEPAFLVMNKKHKPSTKSHSIYVPQAQQNSLQLALHRAAKYIQQQYFCVDQSATTQTSRHERAGKVLLRRAMCQVRVFKFVRFFFPSLFDASLIRKKPTIIFVFF